MLSILIVDHWFAVRRVQQPGGELSSGCRVQARPEHRSLHGEQVGNSVADPDPSDPYDLGLLDPVPLVRGPDPSIIKKNDVNVPSKDK
jgi:hypothetical protein